MKEKFPRTCQIKASKGKKSLNFFCSEQQARQMHGDKELDNTTASFVDVDGLGMRMRWIELP